jgi:hypothetical protein
MPQDALWQTSQRRLLSTKYPPCKGFGPLSQTLVWHAVCSFSNKGFLDVTKKGTVVRQSLIGWGWMVLLGTALSANAQLAIGDNIETRAQALVTLGYEGSYGDQIQSNHGLQVGLDGNFSGYYYNPKFLNFDVTPYFNQSRANSSYQSLTNASGVTASANLFSGSHFPGSVSYDYNYNSTGTLGLAGAPNFTTVGTGQGFGINWSALLPELPTLSVGYVQGSGSGNLYGTDLKTQNDNRTFSLRSSYDLAGFRLNAFYDYRTQHSNYPLFLAGQEANSDTHGDDYGINTSHSLPLNGQLFANYTRSSFTTDYQNDAQGQINNSNYTTDNETAGVQFHPTRNLVLFGGESYVNNLSGYLTQTLVNNDTLSPAVNVDSNSNSFTTDGGASYQFTQNLGGTAQATYYRQHYFDNTYTGTYLSGTVSYRRRLLNTFTFSGGVVDFANGQGNNSVGFVGSVNAFRRIGGWEISGVLSYAQNVQSALITYTTSSYDYSANVHRRWSNRWQWTASFNGNHSGLTNQPDTANHSESYGTTLTYKWITGSALYANNAGNALLGVGGLVPSPPLPGAPNSNQILFSGHNYGAGMSITPLKRLTIEANFNRSLNNTLASTIASRNNIEVVNGQLQYRLRRIQLQAGFIRFTQGISASSALPTTETSYYGGISRWFNFF